MKHDRYNCLCAGNIKVLLHAFAALYLLNLYLRKDKWFVQYNDLSKQDFSVSSTLFEVNPFVAKRLWKDYNYFLLFSFSFILPMLCVWVLVF